MFIWLKENGPEIFFVVSLSSFDIRVMLAGFFFFQCQVLRVLLDNSPVSDMYFVNSFSQSVACILILFMESFTEQTF